MRTALARAMKFHTAPRFTTIALSLTLLAACGGDSDPEPGEDAVSGERGQPGDWSSYGRDHANTRANPLETTITPANVSTLVQKWSFAEGAVTSMPAVYDGTVYFGDWNAVLHAVDAKSGAERWRAQVQEPTPINQINNTTLVTSDTVYTGAQGALLAAYDRNTGALKWSNNIDDQKSLMLWSSPVLIDDTIIIGVGSFQVFLPMTPPFRGSVLGVNAKDGSVKWQRFLTEGSGVSVWSTAAIDPTRKLAFIGTGQEYTTGASTPYSDAVVAIRYETGEIAWAAQFTVGDRFQAGQAEGPDHDVGAAPNLFELNGKAALGVGDKAGRYYALDRDTGAVIWKRELTPGGANGGVMATAAYANGVIYVASNDGNTGGEAGEGGGPGACTIFALNAADGTSRWEAPSTSGTFGALTVANGVLYAPSLAGEMRAYDVNTGARLWNQPIGMSMGAGITVSNGMIYAGHGWVWAPIFPVPGGLVAYGLP
ncbi:MAG TPA: PQQ-binding-like beta-propeller repeat protein [Polyangiales bacterium]|nr:PQQ-binding-like beta-propeller repeat protein [Polyangiales bacterium]